MRSSFSLFIKFFLIVNLCLASTFVQAQKLDKVSVRHHKLEEDSLSKSTQMPDVYTEVLNSKSFTQNDSLFIKFQFHIKGKVIKKGESLSVIPEYKKGNDAYEFPAILLSGEKRIPYYKREQALTTPESYWQYKPYEIVVVGRNQEHRVDYDLGIPLPGGAEKGDLSLKYLKQDCCDISLEKTDSLKLEHKPYTRKTEIVHKLLVAYPEYENSVTYLQPEQEKEKIREEKIIIRIGYPASSDIVLADFANNAVELSRIDSLIQIFTDTQTYDVQEGSIRGYASPEATYDYNLKLSGRRANGFYEYLVTQYPGAYFSGFIVKGEGEDWEGLAEAVKSAEMEREGEVLSIIESYGIFEGRERKLMDLASGDPYRYMLKNLFPPLRRMEMAIRYKVKPFSGNEAEKMWGERPKDLSQREMYELSEGGKNKEPLAAAVQYFPEDATANINASSAALIQGDLEVAYKYLQKVWTEPKAYNNIGVYYMLKEDYENAKIFFEKALKYDEARDKVESNLELLNEMTVQKEEETKEESL